jgi:P27 family predicted phage terminase small subunit
LPPRQADSVKATRGTIRPDRAARRDPTARLVAAPRSPAGLSPAAARAWRSLARELVAAGVLSAMDLPMLRLLAEALATEREMGAVLAAEGLTIAAGSGGRKAHPALRAGADARTTAIRLLEAFGMSPASRQRVDQAPPAREADGPWARLRALQAGR